MNIQNKTEGVFCQSLSCLIPKEGKKNRVPALFYFILFYLIGKNKFYQELDYGYIEKRTDYQLYETRIYLGMS